MLIINRGSGFSLTLANEWTVSVQFGPMNYCDKKIRDIQGGLFVPNKFMDAVDAPMKTDRWEARTAELAAWFGEPGNYDAWWVFRRNPGSDDGDIASWDDKVRGWCTADEVVGFVSYIAGLNGAQPAEILDGRCASPWYEIVGQ